MEENHTFLGMGIKFPPQVNKATGRFEMVSGNESVKESVYLILMTKKGERFIRPEFGSNLMAYPFMEEDTSVLNLMAAELERDIRKGEPRVRNVLVSVNPDMEEGCLIILVDYTVRETNHKDNIVFPFYIREERGAKYDG